MKIILAQYFEIFQISSSGKILWQKHYGKTKIYRLIFLFLIKIRFPKGVSISEVLT